MPTTRNLHSKKGDMIRIAFPGSGDNNLRDALPAGSNCYLISVNSNDPIGVNSSESNMRFRNYPRGLSPIRQEFKSSR